MLVLSLVVPPSTWASFEQLPTGARPAGMGDAFTAVADDVHATYYNPAGLVQLHRSEFAADYSRLYSGLSDGSNISRSFIAYGHPTATHGTFGFSYLSLSLAGLYSESTIGVSYAHSLYDRWNLGGTLKFLRKSYGSDQYTANAINSDTGASLECSRSAFRAERKFEIGRRFGSGNAVPDLKNLRCRLRYSQCEFSEYGAGGFGSRFGDLQIGSGPPHENDDGRHGSVDAEIYQRGIQIEHWSRALV